MAAYGRSSSKACLAFVLVIHKSVDKLPLDHAVENVTATYHVETEREGFEPSIELPLYSISSAAPSTTRPPLLVLTFTNLAGKR